MTTATHELPRIGEGIYTFPEAARILRSADDSTTVRQLRSWMTSGLSDASYEFEGGRDLLAFEDLVSLEVIRRFRRQGVSIQAIRKFDRILRALFPELHRPFAYKRFFTDGADLWISEIGDDHVGTQLTGKKRGHRVWNDAIETFASQISFDEATKKATKWALSKWVDVDPKIQFGAPVVHGTRVKVSTIVTNLDAGTPAQVADWYGLTVEQVTGVADFASASRLCA